jgi:hypothetical protein
MVRTGFWLPAPCEDRAQLTASEASEQRARRFDRPELFYSGAAATIAVSL